MSIEEKKQYKDVSLKSILIRLWCGAKQVYRMRYGKWFGLFWILCLIVIWNQKQELMANYHSDILINVNLIIQYIFSTGIILFLFSKPLLSFTFTKAFHKMGILNHLSEAPILCDVQKVEKHPLAKKYVFLSQGIALPYWKDRVFEIENALNLCVQNITQGRNRQLIEIIAVNGDYRIPDISLWNDSNMHESDTQILVGESYGIKKYVDISHFPHMLLGGTTGSGKTILLKTILYQFAVRKHRVIIMDFKGGVDFYNEFWNENTELVFDKVSLIKILKEVVATLNERKKLYRELGYANIEEHNKYECEKHKRIVLACDEMAQIMDKTGLEKEEKELTSQIEQLIATIARLGRAFGIHIILATQRPDANIISGQIRNNIDTRMCGRCEKVLSQIILDTSDAADLVPDNSCGVFLMHDGTLVKAYYLEM